MKQILSNDIINQYLPTLIHCPLFNKLGEPELKGYLHNAKVIVHSYKKNDFIALSGDPMEGDRKSTRLNSSHSAKSRMPSSA